MIRMKCEKCQSVLNVPDEAAGGKVKCTHCHAVVAVPQVLAKFDSVFGEIRYVGHDMTEMRFRQLFQALLQQEKQAPAYSDDQLVTAESAATNE
jgi:hypothetical protein